MKKCAEECDQLDVHFNVYIGESKVQKNLAGLHVRGDGIDKQCRRRTCRPGELGTYQWKGSAAEKGAHDSSHLVSLRISVSLAHREIILLVKLPYYCNRLIERHKQHKFDKMVYVISSQQDLHMV